MAQQLLIKIIDNDACDERKTPFLMLWQPWGGYTVSAMETAQKIIGLFEVNQEEISSVMNKPNHKNELTDLLVELMHSQYDIWMPQCNREVEEFGYNLMDDRESFWKMTKLVLMANGLPRSAAIINKDTVWDPEGIMVVTDESIDSMLKDSKTRDDVFDVEIGLYPDGTPWIIFRVMNTLEPTLEPSERMIETDAELSYVLICTYPIKKYCDKMSITMWNDFRRLIGFADANGMSLLVNKEENLVLQII